MKIIFAPLIPVLFFSTICFAQTFEVVSNKTFIAETRLVFNAAFYHNQKFQIIDEANCQNSLICEDFASLQDNYFKGFSPFFAGEVCYVGEKAEAITLLTYNMIKFDWLSRDLEVFLSEDQTSQIRLWLKSEIFKEGSAVVEIEDCLSSADSDNKGHSK